MYESDPTKQLTCHVSFDPAIDREAMGDDFVTHFGASTTNGHALSYGTRDPALVKTLPGKRASAFILRPLRAFERAACDTLPSAEARWLSAVQYALVRAELSQPLSTTSEATHPLPDGQRLSHDALDYIVERVGIEAVYEIGAVAYARSRLGPFGRAFAPLPATSALELERMPPSPARTQTESESDTSTTAEGST